MPLGDLAVIDVRLLDRQESVDQIPHGQPVAGNPRRPAGEQVFLFVEPLIEGRLALGIVGDLAEVVEIAPDFLAPPAVRCGEKGKWGRALRRFRPLGFAGS